MTECEYDEKFPYVVATTSGTAMGRFPDAGMADRFAETFRLHFSPDIIDTTPRPRIPDDAKFITWTYSGVEFIYAAARGVDGWHYDGTYGLTSEELIETYIGDEAITVLDVREDQ